MPLASRTGEVKYRIKGDPGADAFFLVTSVSQVYQNMSGSFNPSSFRVYAYKGTAPAVGMYIQVWGSADNQSWTYISYKLITDSNYYIDITVKSAYKYYIIRMYEHDPSTDIDAEPYFFASVTIPVIKDGEPGAQGNPGAKMRMRTWTSGTYYMRGVGEEEWYDVVEYEGRLYLCRVSHTASSSNSPISGTGYWEIAQNWTFIATKLLLAEKIKADMIDADGITAKDVNLTGKITATSGKIGGWIINGNNLECSGFNTKINIEASGTRFMRINNSETQLLYMRAEDSVALDIATYGGENTRGIRVLCNGTWQSMAIETFGNVLMQARHGETIYIKGLRMYSRTIAVSTSLYTYDDFVIFTNASDINVTVVPNSSDRHIVQGKVLFTKRIGSGKVTLNKTLIITAGIKGFRNIDNAVSTSFTINDSIPRMWIFDGEYWNEFYCAK